MTEDQWGSTKLDTTKPNVARIWDFQLGGKDNFAADRLAADKLNEVCRKTGAPDGAAIARETRAWVSRAVRFLAEQGIDQIIDLGVGLPALGNVHEFARQTNPRARTVYVDNDELVMVHGRALLADNAATIAIQGDLRDPDSILADAELRALLDLSRPIAVLLVAVLDLLPDQQAPTSILARIRDAVAPGSYLAVTHVTSDIHEKAAAAIVEEFTRLEVNTPMVPRTGDEIRRLFDGWDLVEPGLVSPALWHPELASQHGEPEPDSRWTYAGIGRLAPVPSTTASAKSARNNGRAGRPRQRRSPVNRTGAPPSSPIDATPVDAAPRARVA